MPGPTLFQIDQGASPETLTLKELWAQEGPEPLAAGYRHIVPVQIDAKTYLIGFDGAGTGAAFELSANAPWLTGAAPVDLGQAADLVEPFQLGNSAYLLAYTAAEGEMAFFPISDGPSLQTPYRFSRRRPPGVTTGFDVVQPVIANNLVCVLAYSSASGDVNAYSLTVTAAPMAGSPPATPALLAAPAWVHQWARDWTRFAFFELGGETFFLKTNTGKLNVNIDHLLDDPSQGTVEVGTYLELENALQLEIVRPFYLGSGDPYFLTYMADGTTTLNRFHGDCQGWTKQLEQNTVAGVSRIVPFQLGEETFALFY